MWYVVQVLKGREDAMAALISRVVPASLLTECFSPKYATETKIRGRWQPVERDLFPGYLIAITDDPLAVEQRLLRMEEFARILRHGDTFIPLAREEVELIGGFTQRGCRVVPMSRAVKDGDRVTVVSGPLMGREGMITGINRHKSSATLQMDFCGRTVSTRVGLAVVSEPQSAEARRAKLYVREVAVRG